MKAVIYKRVSTVMQLDGVSLETQEEKLKAYCILQGWELSNIYEDAGISGKDTNRPAFQRMMQDAQDKKFDAIIVYKLDRLTRSVRDFHELAEKLDKYGIAIVSVTQNLDTSTPVGRLLRNILIDFANFEREMIIERMMDAKLVIAEKGIWQGGKTPFGYIYEDKQLKIHPTESLVVKAIYKDYIEGISMPKLMAKYNLRYGTIYQVLRNPVYAGMVGYCKTSGRGRKMTSMDKWILKDSTHDPLVSKEDYYKVQELKVDRRKIPQERTYSTIFPALCFCGNCDYKLYHLKSGGKYTYYKCGNNMRHKMGCDLSIREDTLENFIIGSVSQDLIKASFWKEIGKGINKTTKANEIKILEDEYSSNNKQINNLADHLARESGQDIMDIVMPKLRKLKDRQNELSKMIEQKNTEQEKRSNFEQNKTIVINFLKYWNYMSIEEKQEASRIIFKKIIVFKDRVIICFLMHELPDMTYYF